METTTQPLPAGQQQPVAQAVPVASSSSSSYSGAIGPFFAVMSVLTVLAFLSCVLGRKLTRDQAALAPLESISERMNCFRWLKRKCRLQCMTRHPDVEFGRPKVIVIKKEQAQVPQLPSQP